MPLVRRLYGSGVRWTAAYPAQGITDTYTSKILYFCVGENLLFFEGTNTGCFLCTDIYEIVVLISMRNAVCLPCTFLKKPVKLHKS